MIDNHDDSDEIDLPVLPAFARLHPNDHPLAVDRGEASGESGQAAAPEHTAAPRRRSGLDCHRSISSLSS